MRKKERKWGTGKNANWEIGKYYGKWGKKGKTWVVKLVKEKRSEEENEYKKRGRKENCKRVKKWELRNRKE